MQAAKKRAAKLEEKGKPVDFAELLKMEPDRGTTNVRKTDSRHWTRWLGVENRCVVPVTRFAEPNLGNKTTDGRTPNAWFARDAQQSLMFLPACGCRNGPAYERSRTGVTTIDLFAFLTTEPNGVVARSTKRRCRSC